MPVQKFPRGRGSPTERRSVAGKHGPTLEHIMNNDVPDQPLNPPEPRTRPDYYEYLEHECDRLNDEALERDSWISDDRARSTGNG